MGAREKALTHAVLLRVDESCLGIAVAMVEVVAVLIHNLDLEDGLDVAGGEVVGLEGSEGLLASLDGSSVGASGQSGDSSEEDRELHLV